MRVFVDTNIVISAMLFPNGKVAKVFSHLLAKNEILNLNFFKKCIFSTKTPIYLIGAFLWNTIFLLVTRASIKTAFLSSFLAAMTKTAKNGGLNFTML